MADGCWKCGVTGHAMFCGCDCHAPEWRKRAQKKAARRLAMAILGSKHPGPFEGVEVTRLDDGTIVGTRYG